MELDGNTGLQEEKPEAADFPALVRESQRRWWQTNGRESVLFEPREFPNSFSQRIFHGILDHLPYYVPQHVKDEVRSIHPEPIISMRGIIASGMFRDKPKTIEDEYLIPEHIESEEDIKAWEDGMEVLDEIATETLATDTLETWRHSQGLKLKWLDPIIRHYIRRNEARQAGLPLIKNFLRKRMVLDYSNGSSLSQCFPEICPE